MEFFDISLQKKCFEHNFPSSSNYFWLSVDKWVGDADYLRKVSRLLKTILSSRWNSTIYIIQPWKVAYVFIFNEYFIDIMVWGGFRKHF